MSKLITVEFREDTLFAIEAPEGVYVAIKPISDGLGLKWSGQHDRLNRSPILAEGIRVMRMPSVGGEQETTCLRLDLLQGWLFGINPGQVKPESRDRVLAYQRECYAALHAHFYGRRIDSAELRCPPADPAREEPVTVRRGLVAEARHTFGVRAAGSLWLSLGLPVVPEMREGRRQGDLGFTYTAVRQDGPGQPQGGK